MTGMGGQGDVESDGSMCRGEVAWEGEAWRPEARKDTRDKRDKRDQPNTLIVPGYRWTQMTPTGRLYKEDDCHTDGSLKMDPVSKNGEWQRRYE